jgi:hypothetical protein
MSTTELAARLASLEADVVLLRQRLEQAETVAGIKLGLDDLNRGLGRPAKDVVKELGAKHCLQAHEPGGTHRRPIVQPI